MKTTNNIIREIISTAKLAVAGAAEFKEGDNKQVFLELFIEPLLSKMEQGIIDNPGADSKQSKELICTIIAVELELQRINQL